jgi:hypothetical protein
MVGQAWDGLAPHEKLPRIWQKPDPDRAERRVRELEASAAALRASLQHTAQLSEELEDIHNALALARIDLAAHRDQRESLEQELSLRRSDATIRQRQEVVALFEDSERRLLDGDTLLADDDVTRRLDAARCDLRLAREELDRAKAERERMLASPALDGASPTTGSRRRRRGPGPSTLA